MKTPLFFLWNGEQWHGSGPWPEDSCGSLASSPWRLSSFPSVQNNPQVEELRGGNTCVDWRPRVSQPSCTSPWPLTVSHLLTALFHPPQHRSQSPRLNLFCPLSCPLKSSSSPWLHASSICNNSQTVLWSASFQALHKHLPPNQWTHTGVQEQLKLIPCSSPSHWPVFPTSLDSNSITKEACATLLLSLSLMSKHLPPHPLWPPNPNLILACLGFFSAPWLVVCPKNLESSQKPYSPLKTF